MKKIEKSKSKINRSKILLALVALVTICGILISSCNNSSLNRALDKALGESEIVYKASTRFLYSTDAGKTWSETIQEVDVDKTYYLAVEMQVSQSEQTKLEKIVTATITIPDTEILSCELASHPGKNVTPKGDNINHKKYYEFNIASGISPDIFRVQFECKPNKEERVVVEVEYDDNVSDVWDRTSVIKYVKNSDNVINGDEK